MDELRPAPLNDADENSICFCDLEEGAVSAIKESKARVIVCSYYIDDIKGKELIRCRNPRLTFMRLCWDKDIYTKPQIDPSAKIGANCHIAPCVVIKENVIIQPNTVIGADGFGYEKNEEGCWERFPHFGRVIIEKDVEIGANCAIDRGKLTDTVIGEGTKIDNLVHVAHNVKIGKHCFIVCGTMIGGSAKLGDNVWTSLNSTIRNWITIGDNALVGMGAVVTKDVAPNSTVIGNPAREVQQK